MTGKGVPEEGAPKKREARVPPQCEGKGLGTGSSRAPLWPGSQGRCLRMWPLPRPGIGQGRSVYRSGCRVPFLFLMAVTGRNTLWAAQPHPALVFPPPCCPPWRGQRGGPAGTEGPWQDLCWLPPSAEGHGLSWGQPWAWPCPGSPPRWAPSA